ncbi:hypothetical protein [Pseudomonas sp. WMBT8]|uniref:hypothetical protein n=1 Tax=Pseudomonas sp. WMBT8 TaxID=3414496 RepID=UPI003D800431
MSEVLRFKTWVPQEIGGSMIEDAVRASDFDRVTAERDALQQRLTAADDRLDHAVTALNEIAKVSRMGEKPFEIATMAIGEMSAGIERPTPIAEVPDGYCIMPRQLTAENGAKALLLGEFKLLVTKECPECCELEEPVEGCSICDGEGEYGQKHTIPWDQIKFIYSKAVSGLAMKAESAKT